MSRLLGGVMLGAMALAPTPAWPQDRRADIAALTEAKLNSWPGFYRSGDGDGLTNFLADGFIHIDGDGAIETKAEAVQWVRTNRWDNGGRDFRYQISDIAFYSADIANVYGTGTYNGAGPDGPCRMSYMSSNVFLRQQGHWRPIFSQTSSARCIAQPASTGN
jgi:hypothetical protein